MFSKHLPVIETKIRYWGRKGMGITFLMNAPMPILSKLLEKLYSI